MTPARLASPSASSYVPVRLRFGGPHVRWSSMTNSQTDSVDDTHEPAEHVALSDPEFKDQLAQVIPHLRAFGRSLSGSRDLADDLVQETLLKA